MASAPLLCGVANCVYVADGAIEDFNVCALHDVPHTRAILERLLRPGALWTADHFPIVIPVQGDLETALIPRLAGPAAIHAADDPWLERIPEGFSKMAHPRYNIMRPWDAACE